MENNTPLQPSPTSPSPSQDPLDAAKDKELNLDAAQAETAPTMAIDHSIAQAHIKQGKSHKGIFIALAVIVALIAVGLGGFAYYYFAIRVQDSDYIQASNYIDAMMTDAKAIVTLPNMLHEFDDKMTNEKLTDSDIKKVSDLEMQAEDYIANLDLLKASPVLSKDSVVSADYSDSHGKIEGYARMSDIGNSIETYLTGAMKADTFANKLNSGKIQTLDDYDAATKDITQYLDQHESVPVKNFNDTIYSVVKNATIAVINDVRIYLTDYQDYGSNDKRTTAALKKIFDDEKSTEDISDKRKNFKFDAPSNPTSDLSDLQTSIRNRQSVFLR